MTRGHGVSDCAANQHASCQTKEMSMTRSREGYVLLVLRRESCKFGVDVEASK